MLEGRLLVSAIMVAVFAIAVGLSFTYAPEARLLPLVIGIPGLLLSAIQLVTELRERNPAPVVTTEEHSREGRMFVWFIGFVAALVLFGFLYAGPALVAAYLYFSGRERWYVALAGAGFAWAVLYGVFDWFLGLPLFEGLVFQYLFG
ncbi:MAG TPA: tripartite tricarboxylate transporter TctB family protein [Micropepsaceae bacterium]|nr:tripartite tricarboxylate transporter TctB family protein [Micropepsaceae bacterium]